MNQNRKNLDKIRITVPGRCCDQHQARPIGPAGAGSNADRPRDSFHQLDAFQEHQVSVTTSHYLADLEATRAIIADIHRQEGEANTAKRSTLQKKAKRKDFTRQVNKHLTRLQHSPLFKYYQRGADCCKVMRQEGDKLRTWYCQCKHCLVCCSIRTARLIQDYLPYLERFEDPQMITLTYPDSHVTDHNLKDETKQVISKWRTIYKWVHKKWRKEGIVVQGFRGLESTGDWDKKRKRHKYHPHLHIIVDGLAIAKDIQRKWLELSPGATEINQRIVPADIKGMKEILKYFTKFVDKKYRTVTTRKGKTKRICYKKEVNIHRLDVMLQSFFSLRLFNAFGIEKINIEDSDIFDNLDAQRYEDIEMQVTKWFWDDNAADWIDITSGELLAQNIRTDQEQALIDSIRPCSNRKLVLMQARERKKAFITDA